MPLKQNWTDRDTVTATFLNQLASAVNSAVASLAGKYTKPAGGIPASDLAGNVLDKTTADTIYAPKWLPSTAYTAGALVMLPAPINGPGTRNAEGTSRESFDTTEQGAWTVSAASSAQGAKADAAVPKSSGAQTVYATDSNGAQVNVSYAEGTTSKTLARRDINGAINSQPPINSTHLTTKGYVDSLVSGIVEVSATATISTSSYALSSSATMHFLTLAISPTTITFPTATAGKTLTLLLKQDSTGTRTVTTWPSAVKWQGGSVPVLSVQPNNTDVLTFISDGTNWYGFFSGKGF